MALWAAAKVDIGLSDDEFWDLTPSMFEALMRRRWPGQQRRTPEQQAAELDLLFRKNRAILRRRARDGSG